MTKHKLKGFTVIELIVVIVVIALLVTVATVVYRETQKNARDQKRKSDVIVLMGALDEYYADKGGYPQISCPSPGGTYECWRNEAWTNLKSNGYLQSIPTPDTKASTTSYNVGDSGNANYGWLWSSNSSYAIYVPMEGGDCKVGKNVTASWWGSLPSCSF